MVKRGFKRFIMNSLKSPINDRRQYPRVTTEWPATLFYDDKTEIETTLTNISRYGLNIKCSKMIASTMLSERFQPIPGNTARVSLIFELSPGSGNEIMVQCDVVRAERSSQNDFTLCFKYVDIDESDFSLINDYINTFYAKHLTLAFYMGIFVLTSCLKQFQHFIHFPAHLIVFLMNVTDL